MCLALSTTSCGADFALRHSFSFAMRLIVLISVMCTTVRMRRQETRGMRYNTMQCTKNGVERTGRRGNVGGLGGTTHRESRLNGIQPRRRISLQLPEIHMSSSNSDHPSTSVISQTFGLYACTVVSRVQIGITACLPAPQLQGKRAQVSLLLRWIPLRTDFTDAPNSSDMSEHSLE